MCRAPFILTSVSLILHRKIWFFHIQLANVYLIIGHVFEISICHALFSSKRRIFSRFCLYNNKYNDHRHHEIIIISGKACNRKFDGFVLNRAIRFTSKYLLDHTCPTCIMHRLCCSILATIRIGYKRGSPPPTCPSHANFPMGNLMNIQRRLASPSFFCAFRELTHHVDEFLFMMYVARYISVYVIGRCFLCLFGIIISRDCYFIIQDLFTHA